MAEVLLFLMSYFPDPWIMAGVLGFLPISEVRIAILYGLLAGLDHSKLFAVTVVSNIIETAVLFSILGNKKIAKLFDRLIGRKISKKIIENKKKFEKYEELALVFVVSATIPGSGAFVASLVSKALKLDRKKSFIAICAGILLSAALVFIAAGFFMSLFGSFFR